MRNVAGTCLSCGEALNAPPTVIRAHLDSHPAESYPWECADMDPDEIEDHDHAKCGRAVLANEFILSCNCGECDFCRSKP